MAVLIVDGSERIRASLRDLFADHGVHEVREAAERASALAALSRAPAEVVLIGATHDTVALIGEIRALAPDASVIVLVQEIGEPQRRAFALSGATAVLDKAFEFERAIELAVAQVRARGA